jgi:hypothetical protein
MKARAEEVGVDFSVVEIEEGAAVGMDEGEAFDFGGACEDGVEDS